MLNVPSSQQHNLLCTPIHQFTIVHYHKSHQWSHAQYKFRRYSRLPNAKLVSSTALPTQRLHLQPCDPRVPYNISCTTKYNENSPVDPAAISTFLWKAAFPIYSQIAVHISATSTHYCPHISTTRSVFFLYNLYKITLQQTHRHSTIIYLLWSATTSTPFF